MKCTDSGKNRKKIIELEKSYTLSRSQLLQYFFLVFITIFQLLNKPQEMGSFLGP